MKSYKQFLSLSLDKFLKLNKSELKLAVQTLGYTANARIKSLKKAGLNTPATKYASFSVKDKNVNELRMEFMRAKQLLNLKSSTRTGAKQIMKSFYQRLKLPIPKLKSLEGAKETKRFWEIYNKLKELYDIGGKGHTYDSTEVQRMIWSIENSNYGKGLSVEQLLDIAEEEMDEMAKQ